MIAGIGIDLIEAERFRGETYSEQQGPFTGAELAYCLAKRYPERHLAGRFAAKEAFFKALGSGALTPGEFELVEVVNDPSGNPSFKFSGAVAERVAAMKITKIHLSLTHTVTTAAAVVILEA